MLTDDIFFPEIPEADADTTTFPEGRPCPFPKAPRPAFTMQEEFMRTTRRVQETLNRVMRLEEHIKTKLENYLSTLTNDNVTFKDLCVSTYNDFAATVRDELNTFEADITNSYNVFAASVTADHESFIAGYNTFRDSIEARIDEYNDNHEAAFNAYVESLNAIINNTTASLNERYSEFVAEIEAMQSTFEGSVEGRLDAQDAIIADADHYMRSNLTATLTQIISDMEANGEFNDILQSEVFNFTKNDYNAVTLADTVIEKAQECYLDGKIFYVPKNVELTLTETLDLSGMDVDIQGSIILDHDDIGIIVGGTSSPPSGRTIYINEVTRTTKAPQPSIRIIGMSNGIVHINNAQYVQLYADGDTDHDFIAYSTFHIGKCDQLELTDNPDASAIGWVNENIFYVRVCDELKIVGNTYSHNNNVFYKPCIEGGAALYLENCERNSFYDVRTEGDFSLTFEEGSRNNRVYSAHYYANPTQMGVDITDNGDGNIFSTNAMLDYESATIYKMDARTFENRAYKISDETNFSVVDGDSVKASVAWSKLIYNDIISAKNIRYIIMRADVAQFRLYITPLDSNGNVMLTNPLSYAGATQNSDGEYGVQANSGFIVVEKTDPSVAYFKITLSTGGGVATFKNVCLNVYYPRTQFNHPLSLVDRYKNKIYPDTGRVIFYNMNAKTIAKGLYDIARKGFRATGEDVSCLTAWTHIISGDTIDVRGLTDIDLNADIAMFRLSVTPLDSNGEVLLTNPLIYTGDDITFTQDSSTGEYVSDRSLERINVHIADTAVKSIMFTLQIGEDVSQSFKGVSLSATYDPSRFFAAGMLADRYRKSIISLSEEEEV